MNKKNVLVLEWFAWVTCSIFAFIIEIFVPLSAVFIVLAAPAPFMTLTRRLGLRPALLGALAGTGFIFITSDAPTAIIYLVMFALTGMAFGIAAAGTDDGADFLLKAIAASVTAKVLLTALFTLTTGTNPFSISPEAAKGLVSAISGAMAKGGAGFPAGSVDAYASNIVSTVSTLMPSMLILFASLDTLVTYLIVSGALKKLGSAPLPSLPPFGSWRFPKNIFWALLLSIIVQMMSRAMPDTRALKVISDNLLEVLRAVLMLEGLSLCWFFMTTKNINKAMKVFVTAFFVFFSPLSYILSMVGIFDIWYDLRKLAGRKNKS